MLREALIAGDRQQVPLRRELELVRRYLDIQQARFGDRLQADIEVDETVMDALVPHFVLQPLVENAIRHGIGARSDAGRVRIRAQADHDALRIDVEDDGAGLKEAGASEGIGLGNTQAAGSPCRAGRKCAVRDDPRGGAIVTVTIPLHAGP